MPRFVESLLKILSHWVTVVMGIAILTVVVFLYNRPTQANHSAPSQTYSTAGLSPSEDAGILGGIAAQQQKTEAMTRELSELKAKLDRLERKPAPPSNTKANQLLQQQLKALQTQIAQGNALRNTANPTPLAPPPTPVSLRVIREASAASLTAKTRHRIQVGESKDTQVSPAPYLPPQSFATGRVKDGYTGLASIETFPVTIEATSAFNAPNGHRVPLTGCRFGATSTPEELTARGRLALTKITCVNANGLTIERPISGYVTAADNINGQIAKVFWHEREVVAAFAKSAVPAALVSLFRETRRVVDVATLTGVLVQSSNSVAQEVAGRMADIYLDKAEKLASPIIWVAPDTPIYIYITQGARLEGLQTVEAARDPLARRILQ